MSLKSVKQCLHCNKKLFLLALLGIAILLSVTLFSNDINVMFARFKNFLSDVGLFTEEVKSIEIVSDNYDEPGSYKLTKSAEWTSNNTARITMDLEPILKLPDDRKKDVILVVDISGSMSGDKLERVKQDSSELVEYLLSDAENRVGLITFDTESEIVSTLTNDKESMLEHISNLQDTGTTNYYDALKNVDVLLSEINYQKEENRDLITLFLTDGYPNEKTPNQIGMYEILKGKYPYMQINGVQYEMGVDIIDEIKEITDEQYAADMVTLNNILFEAAIAPLSYDNFIIEDYIDDEYFYVENSEAIKTDLGNATLTEENGVQKITWDFGNVLKTGKSATMTIDVKLKEQYVGSKGYYPTNEREVIISKLPEDEEEYRESLERPILKNYYNVIYDMNEPTGCDLGDNIVEEHYIYENVTKRTETPSCSGYTFKGWEIVDEDVTKVNDEVFVMPDKDITIRATWSKVSIDKNMDGTVYTGENLYKKVQSDALNNNGASMLESTSSDTYPVYYYTDPDVNNVLFGGFCWKIARTTETGGVKLVYNGEPDENGSCDNTGSATQLSSTSAFNRNSSSTADVGYMYNTRYTYNLRDMTSRQTVVSTISMSSTTSYYYSDTYNYTSSLYYMDNPEQLEWGSNYENLEGKYTCRSTSSNGYCSSIYYIVKVDSSRMYYLILSSGNDLSYVGTTLTLGSDYTDNGDGTYTLIDTIEVDKADWYSNYTSYRNYYVCGTNNTTTCSNLRYITSSSSTSYNYVNLVDEYLYGNSFTYDSVNNTYTLVDTKGIWNWSTGYNTINSNHYTCFNTTGICTSEIYYVYYTDDSIAGYIRLSNGKTVETALEEMLSADDVNTTDSTIKGVIDTWYEANMTKYTDYLEDTIWCNDRSISDLAGWNPNGGSTTNYLYFRSSSNSTDLSCPSKIDSFTVNESEHGNGALDYPVGLLTRQEAYLMGSSALTTGSYYWLLSPYRFSDGSADGYLVRSSGSLSYDYVVYSVGVRPAVSLNPGAEYASGDGSVYNPYVIITE